MKNYNQFNRKSLKFFRASLRNRSTSAEAALWNILKSRNLDGKKFRRDKYLTNYGFTVLRFENRVVFQEPEYVKSKIRKIINKENNLIN